MATKHDDSVKGGEFPELTKAVREGGCGDGRRLRPYSGRARLGVKRSPYSADGENLTIRG